MAADGELPGYRTSLDPGRVVEVKIGGKAIKLHMDNEVGVGGRLWNASIVLLQYFDETLPTDYFKGKRVLELGAGLGLISIVLANRGAIVTCTDMAVVMPALQRNVDEANAAASPGLGSLRAARLEWGAEGWETSPLSAEPAHEYDVIIGSEIMYYAAAHPHLIWTLQRVWAPHTVAYFTFKERFFDCRRFFNELEASEGRVKFETEEVESFDSLGVDELCLYVVRGNLA